MTRFYPGSQGRGAGYAHRAPSVGDSMVGCPTGLHSRGGHPSHRQHRSRTRRRLIADGRRFGVFARRDRHAIFHTHPHSHRMEQALWRQDTSPIPRLNGFLYHIPYIVRRRLMANNRTDQQYQPSKDDLLGRVRRVLTHPNQDTDSVGLRTASAVPRHTSPFDPEPSTLNTRIDSQFLPRTFHQNNRGVLASAHLTQNTDLRSGGATLCHTAPSNRGLLSSNSRDASPCRASTSPRPSTADEASPHSCTIRHRYRSRCRSRSCFGSPEAWSVSDHRPFSQTAKPRFLPHRYTLRQYKHSGCGGEGDGVEND